MASKCPYACVASPSGEIVVERSVSNGNASDIAGRIIQRLPRKPGEPGRKTYTMGVDGYAFRLAWKAGGYTFVVLEKGLGDQTAWKFLGRMRQQWEAQFGGPSLIDAPITTTVARPFAETLNDMLTDPSSVVYGSADPNGANDELGAVNERLEQVRHVMHDSIEKVLERGERIELLVDRADRLEQNATTFAKKSTALKRQYKWRNVRCYVMFGAAVVAGILLLAVVQCGGFMLTECRRVLPRGGDGPQTAVAEGFVAVGDN